MNRRQELQHDLHQVVQSRAQLSRLFTAAQRVERRGSVGALRLIRKRKSLALLRLVMEIGGLNPVAVLTARNLLKRPRDSDASMEAERATLQALLDTRQCRADALRVNRHGHGDVYWRKALRLVAECLLLEQLYQMNLRGSTPTGRHLVDILVAVWPAVGRGEVFELVVTPLRTCPIRRKKWLEQFRLFWGVAYERMQVRGVIFPEQETARVFRAGTIFGLQTRAQNRDPFWTKTGVTTYCFYTVGPGF